MKTAIEIRQQMVDGTPFTFKSLGVKGRVYTVKAILRNPIEHTLFIINATGLKVSSGLYNQDNILAVLQKAIENKPQSTHKLR